MRFLALGLTLIIAFTGSLLIAAPASAEPVTTAPPDVRGKAVYDARLTATTGSWTTGGLAFSYRWLRDGQPIGSSASQSYRPRLEDLGHRLSVRVTATDADGATTQAVSAETSKVKRARLGSRKPPKVNGVSRYTRTVRATPGRWAPAAQRVRFQWMRGGTPIRGATGKRYTFAPADVGTRIRVRATATAPGYRSTSALSRKQPPVQHRVDVRRTVTYSVVTRGRIRTDVGEFRRLAQQTFTDARGWRSRGVAFRPVRTGGSFTLVLAEASTVPSFSSQCSSVYSCRVGRFVIINQTRWNQATPVWNGARRSLRDYRHMVVNHETGHWLGFGHASCPGAGQLAPVMQQQSKGTQGCRLNPWPTSSEIRR